MRTFFIRAFDGRGDRHASFARGTRLAHRRIVPLRDDHLQAAGVTQTDAARDDALPADAG
jgi:hypothetical protein